jgi:glycosyltransferase involved in cell wall biosynthesis
LACRKSEALIIQDEERFEVFCGNYEYRHPKVFYLPNSALDEVPPQAGQEENLFRRKFNFTHEEFPVILLQAGMINDMVLSRVLAESFASIGDGCALVFHERSRNFDASYIRMLGKLNVRNLFLSLEPVPPEELHRIYLSADIGLAFYWDHSDNWTKISMASGKLAQYLKYAKPVIVSNFPSLRRLVEKYACGIAIKDPADPDEIRKAVDKIMASYETYSKNARHCFDEEFDFAKKAKPLIEFMGSL